LAAGAGAGAAGLGAGFGAISSWVEQADKANISVTTATPPTAGAILIFPP
jgi:hypothetical protein